MDKKIFVVRSVSATLKGGGAGTAASLALQRHGFAPQEYENSVCTSVPREGERFILQIDGGNSNQFFLYRANSKVGKWDNALRGIFSRTGGKAELNGSRVFSGSADGYEMISFVTDFDPIAFALKDVPVVPKAVGSPVKAMPGLLPQTAIPSPKTLDKPRKLSQEEIAEISSSFLKNREPNCHQPYEVTKAVLQLVNGDCKAKKVSDLLDLCIHSVYRSLYLKDLPDGWIEKMRKETPRSMRCTMGELIELSKIKDRNEREKRYSDLLAEKAKRAEKTVPREKAETTPPVDTPEIREYAEKFVAKQASRTTPSRKETQADTIEAVLWFGKRNLNGQEIARLMKISSPTAYMYLPLLQLPEEWLKQLSLEILEEERLLPQDAVRLAAIEDVEERRKQYDEIAENRRKKIGAKRVKSVSVRATKRKYTRRTEAVETPPAAQTPNLPLTIAEKVEVFRKWIKQGKEIISEVQKKGDNKLEPPVQGALLEALRGLIKILGGICEGRALHKEDPYPQDVLYLVRQLSPILLHADTLADELERSILS